MKIKIVVAAVAMAVGLAGCSSSKSQAAPTPPATTMPAPTPVASIPAPTPVVTFSAYDYESSQRHVAPLQAALNAYGAAVLPAIMSYHWGLRDAFCNQPNEDDPNNYISKGYIPKSGDTCNVAHSPDYGGSKELIEANVVVGPSGSFSNQFSGAAVMSPDCTVLVDSFQVGSKLTISVSIGNGIKTPTTLTAKSLAQAEAIDTLAIACLNRTRP
jgi:hypothetical protein